MKERTATIIAFAVYCAMIVLLGVFVGSYAAAVCALIALIPFLITLSII
jgi:hypothetical protein